MVAVEVEELDQAGYGSDDGENSESGGGGYSGALVLLRVLRLTAPTPHS